MKSFQLLSQKWPLFRCLSYIADATPRKATGHGRGGGKCSPSHSLKFMFTLTDFLLSLFDYNIIFTVLPAYLIR